MNTVVGLLVDLLEPDVLRRLPADTGTGDNGRGLPQLRGPFDARIGHGFTRRDDCELREAVNEVGAAILEIRPVAVALDFGAVPEPETAHIARFDRRDAAASHTQRF